MSGQIVDFYGHAICRAGFVRVHGPAPFLAGSMSAGARVIPTIHVHLSRLFRYQLWLKGSRRPHPRQIAFIIHSMATAGAGSRYRRAGYLRRWWATAILAFNPLPASYAPPLCLYRRLDGNADRAPIFSISTRSVALGRACRLDRRRGHIRTASFSPAFSPSLLAGIASPSRPAAGLVRRSGVDVAVDRPLAALLAPERAELKTSAMYPMGVMCSCRPRVDQLKSRLRVSRPDWPASWRLTGKAAASFPGRQARRYR